MQGQSAGSNQWSKSSLQFSTGPSYQAGISESFYVGNLDYHNGTTLIKTNATGVNFELDLAFALEGNNYGTGFDFDFNIQTTENTENLWESADFVFVIAGFIVIMIRLLAVKFKISLPSLYKDKS